MRNQHAYISRRQIRRGSKYDRLGIDTIQARQMHPARFSLKTLQIPYKARSRPVPWDNAQMRQCNAILPSANPLQCVSGTSRRPENLNPTLCSLDRTTACHLGATPSDLRNRNGTIDARSLDCRIRPLVQRWVRRNNNISLVLGSRLVPTSVSFGMQVPLQARLRNHLVV
jgi:hypothetical protein